MSPLFKRNKKTTIAELEEYYANQNNRPLRAWAMAIFSLILTIAVLAGLFFGGKWLYNQITGDDTTTPVTIGTQEEGTNGALPGFVEDEPTPTGESDETAVSNDEAVVSEGVVSDEAATTTRTDVVATGDTSEDIPNTGAGSSILLVAVVTTAIGYFISRKSQLR